MKRKICFILALLMLASAAFALIPAGAADEAGAEEPASSLNDSLIIHYNFEGNSLEERLRDKAGKSQENLSLFTTQDDMMQDLSYITEDGIAYINEAKGNYLISPTANIGEDVWSLTKTEGSRDLTVVVVFKFENNDDCQAATDIFHINNLARMAINTPNNVNSVFSRFGYQCGFNNYKTQQITSINNIPKNEWIYMAFTLSEIMAPGDGQGGMYSQYCYISTNIGVTYEKKGAVVSPEAVNPQDGTTPFDFDALDVDQILLGKATIGISDKRGSMYYKDFRVYDTALSDDQISQVFSEISIPGVVPPPPPPQTDESTEEQTPEETPEPETPPVTPTESTKAPSTTAEPAATNAPADNNNNPSNENEDGGNTVVIVIAVIAGVCVVGTVLFFLLKKKK